MEYIKIPMPDFSLSDEVKKKAVDTAKSYLRTGTIKSFAYGHKNSRDKFYLLIEQDFYFFRKDEDKLLYISEFFAYIISLYPELNIPEKAFNSFGPPHDLPPLKDDSLVTDKLNELKFFLYNLASQMGYNFDRNAFDSEEVNDLERKINAILIKLDEIQVGNEVIFNEVEGLKTKLKEDFKSLKSDYPLGKKRWYQRAAGIVVSYAGTKGADEVYGQLKPLIRDFFVNHAPHLIDKL